MENFKLTKTALRNGFKYEVIAADGTVIASRCSKRDYVAAMICKSAQGQVYVPNLMFGRVDLIGKGDSRHFVSEQIATAQLEE